MKHKLPISSLTFSLFIIGILLCFACTRQKNCVGLIVNNHIEQTAEVQAICKLLDKHSNEISYKLIPINHLSELGSCDVVWYHRPDSVAIQTEEINAEKAIKKYVQKGGQLILSMDAVRLLNTWGIETTPIDTSYFNAVDEGFGRKLGFHAFQEHPLFDHFFGGAYTWHGKVDNRCRVLGFLGDHVPSASGSRVIAILWEYIFYHPKEKVIWETPLGKGRILAIGEGLYYSKPNFHAKILDQFTVNCIDFMLGDSSKTSSHYWEYNKTGIINTPIKQASIVLNKPQLWTNPKSIHLKHIASDYPFDLSSQRVLIVGKENAGIEEIWTHPMMSVRDFNTRLDIAGVDTLVPLSQFKPTFEMRPNAIIRNYRIGKLLLKEIITCEIKNPVVLVHYEWDGSGLNRIITDFKSNLRYMWPYDSNALGSLHYCWNKSLNAFVVTDKNREFCSLIGSNLKGEMLDVGRYDDFAYRDKRVHGVNTDKIQVAASVAYNTKQSNALDLFMVAGNQGIDSVITSYNLAMQDPNAILAKSNKYYEDYLSTHLQISTPDPFFNEGYKWAVLRSSQFISYTPGIGTSLLAGFSSSRRGWGGAQKVSGRPGYAWYFGRDAVWSGMAFNDMGDFETVKNVLKTMIRYQEVDGKIYHELTTSGSVHFDASDATPLFVILMARYLQNSGDSTFVRDNMDAIHKAMDYCYSTDTDGDHLIEISNVGHGWLEGGALYGSKTEFYLVGLWNAALNDAAYLSKMTGNILKYHQYADDAQIVNNILNRDFWNPKGYYNYGKKEDGSFTDKFIVLPTVPVYLGLTDSAKSLTMIKQLASSHFSTDWGVRMIDEKNSLFNPTAYHFGSIWPLFTGWTSLAEYKMRRYIQGFTRIMSNLGNYKHFSQGCVPEVINGLVYKPAGVTLHQCWSETMVIQPTIEGLLGYTPAALKNTMSLAPRFPFDWDSCQVKNITMGNVHVNFDMQKTQQKMTYIITSDHLVKLNFSPVFPPGTHISSLVVNGKVTAYSIQELEEYLQMSSAVELTKQTTIEINYDEGVSALPSINVPQEGLPSSGCRILAQHWKDKELHVTVEGYQNSTHGIELYLPNGYASIKGGTHIQKIRKNVFSVDIAFGRCRKNEEKYTTQEVIITTK